MYNRQQQGYGYNNGGVPQGNVPTTPNVHVGDVIQQYIPVITAKLANDMMYRGTEYSNYMAQLFSQNGYNNDLMIAAIQMVGEYAEYVMSKGDQFNYVIDGIVSDCNSLILENHYRTNPNSIPVQVTHGEVIKYQAARSKMSTLRNNIASYIANKEKNMSNQQYGSFPMPNQGGQYPQHNLSQQQQYEYQRQVAEQQWYRQQLQQRGGHVQPGSSEFAQRVQRNMAANQQPQGFGQSSNGFGQQPQGFGQSSNGFGQQPQGFGQPSNGFGFPVAGQQYGGNYNAMMDPRMQQSMMQQQNHPGQFATNSNHFHGMHQPQPQPSKLASQSGYNPMPKVDEAQLRSQRFSSDTVAKDNPFELNDKIMRTRQSSTPSAKVGIMNEFSKGNSPKSENNDEYEIKVRLRGKELGLPYMECSISYLESAISEIDGKDTFIDKNNAYSEINKNATTVKPTGHYDGNVMLGDDVMVQECNDSSDDFATKIRNTIASGSDKKFIKQSDGQYVVVSSATATAFAEEYPNGDINKADMRAFKNAQSAPYPFAVRNLDGEWIVPVSRFNDIKNKGIFIYSVAYPVVSRVGFYVLDDTGMIINFYSKPRNEEQDAMDYELHDDSKFFTPLTKKDVNVVANEARMLEVFSQLQNEQRIEEVLRDIEEQAGVLNVEDDTLLIVDKSIVFEEQHNGNMLGDDYYSIGYNKLTESLNDQSYLADRIAFRYTHVHMYPWQLKDDDLALVRRLRYKDTYSDIADTINEMAESKGFPDSWFTRLNTLATNYVNMLLETRFVIPEEKQMHIRSFALDVVDVHNAMIELGQGKEFEATARELTQTILYPWLSSSQVYEDYYGTTTEGDLDDTENSNDDIKANFAVIRDVSVIPLHSREIPIYVNSKNCILTEHGFKSLWVIAKDRMENKKINVAEVVIVTSDNRAMYIYKSAIDDVFVISAKSIISE